MAVERTLSIIKPECARKNITGKIITKLEEGGLSIIAQKHLHLTEKQASLFYAVHKDRPFFPSLVKYMCSGPVVVQVLQGENAVAQNRQIMGATDPKSALSGTIRKEFGESIEANAVHGSDSVENAKQEISFFFAEIELLD